MTLWGGRFTAGPDEVLWTYTVDNADRRLLLDDIFSELDARHRDRVIHTAYAVDQVLITTPDPDRPGADELPGAIRYDLANGELTRR